MGGAPRRSRRGIAAYLAGRMATRQNMDRGQRPAAPPGLGQAPGLMNRGMVPPGQGGPMPQGPPPQGPMPQGPPPDAMVGPTLEEDPRRRQMRDMLMSRMRP